MVAGFERYFQIARALRDEDQRGDRQPEHTQLDLEMSYTTQDEILDLVEGLYAEIVEQLTEKKLLAKPFPRLTYAEAMDRFGTDKPDIRFGLELGDVSEIAASSEFKVFKGAVDSGGSVRGIAVGDLGDLTRREIDDLTAVAASGGARGLAHFRVQPDGLKSPVAKFFSEEQLDALRVGLGADEGDWMFFVADKNPVVFESLNRLRLHFRDRLGLADPDVLGHVLGDGLPALRVERGGGQDRADAPHVHHAARGGRGAPGLGPLTGHRPALRPRRQRHRARFGEHQDPPSRPAAEGLRRDRHRTRGGQQEVRNDPGRPSATARRPTVASRQGWTACSCSSPTSRTSAR